MVAKTFMRPYKSFWEFLSFSTVCCILAVASGLGQVGSTVAKLPIENEDAVVHSVKFAVASIRQVAPSDNDPMIMNFSDDGLSFKSVPIAWIVQQAFSPQPSIFVQDNLVLGLPGWTRSERYDINAKVDDEDIIQWKAMSASQRRFTLQSLLVTRFGIHFHHETRERPTYSLVTAKNGSKLYSTQLSKADSNNITVRDSASSSEESTVTPGKIVLKGSGLSAFARLLSSQGLDHAVIDKTNLPGRYDITLRWTPDNTDLPNASLPSLFTALQEQLGLKLEYNKNPEDVVMVEHIERPSPN